MGAWPSAHPRCGPAVRFLVSGKPRPVQWGVEGQGKGVPRRVGTHAMARRSPAVPRMAQLGCHLSRVHLSLQSLLRDLPTLRAGNPSRWARGSAELPGPRRPNTGTFLPGASECLGCSQSWGCREARGVLGWPMAGRIPEDLQHSRGGLAGSPQSRDWEREAEPPQER